MTPATRILATLLALALQPMGGICQAQIAQPMAEDTAVMELQLRGDSPIAQGQMAIMRGTADVTARRFRVGNLNVVQPVVAAVLAQDDAADLRLTLLKPGRETPRLTASTAGKGRASISTRTQGAVDILVESPAGPAPAALLVWVGDEVRPRLADVLVSPAEFHGSERAGSARRTPARPEATSGRRSSTGVLIIEAFASGGILVLATLLLARRKSA